LKETKPDGGFIAAWLDKKLNEPILLLNYRIFDENWKPLTDVIAPDNFSIHQRYFSYFLHSQHSPVCISPTQIESILKS